MKVRLDRPVSNAEVSCDLGNRQTTEIVKTDRNPLLVRETTKSFPKIEQLGTHVSFANGSDSGQDLAAASTVSSTIHQPMKSDAANPRCRIVVSTDLVPLPVSSNKRLLHSVGSRLGVERNRQRTNQTRIVLREELIDVDHCHHDIPHTRQQRVRLGRSNPTSRETSRPTRDRLRRERPQIARSRAPARAPR